MNINNVSLRYDLILGSRRISNYFWFFISFIGGIGFLTVGLASYFGTFSSLINNSEPIRFIPQGIVMTFYGSISLLLSIFLLVNIIVNVGGGYNKYDKAKEKIEIFRLGFPNQTREVYLKYQFQEIRSIKLKIQEGLNPKREIYLCTKDQRQIPLTRVGEPLLLSSIEEEAVDLSLFLNVPLES